MMKFFLDRQLFHGKIFPGILASLTFADKIQFFGDKFQALFEGELTEGFPGDDQLFPFFDETHNDEVHFRIIVKKNKKTTEQWS